MFFSKDLLIVTLNYLFALLGFDIFNDQLVGVVLLEDASDSTTQSTKVVFGFFGYNMDFMWVDSTVIEGELLSYDLPDFSGSHGYSSDGITLVTEDSIHLISINYVNNWPNDSLSTYHTSIPSDGIIEVHYERDFISYLVPLQDSSLIFQSELYGSNGFEDSILIADSIIIFAHDVNEDLHTVHYANNKYVWQRHTFYSKTSDTLFIIPDSFGRFVDISFGVNSDIIGLSNRDSNYYVFRPDWPPGRDTIIHHTFKKGIQLVSSDESYFFVDTFYNNQSYITKILYYSNTYYEKDTIPGHAYLLRPTSDGFLYFDSISNNLLLNWHGGPRTDTLAKRSKLPFAFAPIHLIINNVDPIESSKSVIDAIPNPSEDVFYLKIPDQYATHPFLVELYNIEGKLLKSLRYDTQNQTISLKGLPKGIILVRVSNEHIEETIKLIHY